MVSQSPKIDSVEIITVITAILIGWFLGYILYEPNNQANEHNAKPTATIRELCVKGVTYYDFYGYTGAVSIALDKDGKVIPCGNEK